MDLKAKKDARDDRLKSKREAIKSQNTPAPTETK